MVLVSVGSGCEAGEWVRIDSKTISFKGTIEIEELRRFQEVYKPTDETIILNSGGGRMDAALDIGKILIQNKKLTAIVQGMCASSCANYLFLAAKNKVIDHGIVGFHGNWKAMVNVDTYNTHLAALEPVERAKMDAFHKQHVLAESEFLSKSGASQSLFDRTQKENDAGVYEVYLPGPLEFEKYGIHNVKGGQDLDFAKGLAVLYENGPNDNNAEELKQTLRKEFVSAPEKRKNQIRAALKLLNDQYPPQQTSAPQVSSPAVN